MFLSFELTEYQTIDFLFSNVFIVLTYFLFFSLISFFLISQVSDMSAAAAATQQKNNVDKK